VCGGVTACVLASYVRPCGCYCLGSWDAKQVVQAESVLSLLVGLARTVYTHRISYMTVCLSLIRYSALPLNLLFTLLSTTSLLTLISHHLLFIYLSYLLLFMFPLNAALAQGFVGEDAQLYKLNFTKKCLRSSLLSLY